MTEKAFWRIVYMFWNNQIWSEYNRRVFPLTGSGYRLTAGNAALVVGTIALVEGQSGSSHY
jgi:hypothetical protein